MATNSDAHTIIDAALAEHKRAVEGCLTQSRDTLIHFSELLVTAWQSGNKVMICGNGGSTCDALHFAGECVGRFVNDRKALPAIALNADPGILTAVGNDYGFDHIFTRQLQAHAREGDLFIAISTSGKSPNIVQVCKEAKHLHIPSLLLTGERGKNAEYADHVIAVPSTITAHIQETHITLLQLLVALCENKLF